MDKNRILLERTSAWDKVDGAEKDKVFEFSDGYRIFLDAAKTERESVDEIRKTALASGFKPIGEYNGRLKPGDRVIIENRNKALVLALIGEGLLDDGALIVGAHIDSPRLDLKPEPLYEDSGLALFKTHYYGGIKKYQWVTIPLALHGVVITAEGKSLDIKIGEADNEPVFTITDLLPHLAKDQMKKKLGEGITGEALNILVGGMPLGGKTDGGGKDGDCGVGGTKGGGVKEAILGILHRKYGITEEDFISAELEAVPAWPARDVGFDLSFVGGYGQDDRVCSYTALRAICGLDKCTKTAIALFVDKEEIGSVGSTSMGSMFFENAYAEIYSRVKGDYNDLDLRRSLQISQALSADVNVGFDPTYADVAEKQNTAYLGYGVVLTKYTGSRGKSGASDASAEFTYRIRKIFNENAVSWQTGELGKVDQGGGGTIAYLLARYNMNVIDCGPPVLSMHAPFEITSKIDIYMTYRAYCAFFRG